MKIVFFGSDDFALPALDAIAGSVRHALLGVVSQPDRPAGRGRRLHPTAVSAWARARGLPLICPERVNQPGPADTLAQWGGQIGVVIAFGQKIGNAILDSIPHGCINLHSSLLPKYRGAAPIARAIINGDAETGVSIFRLVEKMDAGPVVCRKSLAILPTETAGELRQRLAAVGAAAIIETLDAVEQGSARFEPQDDDQATAAPELTHQDGRLDWGQSAAAIANRIRGLYPWPGVRVRFVSQAGREEDLILARAVAEATPALAEAAEPGTLRPDLAVAAGAGAVRLLEVKPASHRLMSFADFVNGHHVRPGDRFVQPASPEP